MKQDCKTFKKLTDVVSAVGQSHYFVVFIVSAVLIVCNVCFVAVPISETIGKPYFLKISNC